MRVLVTGAQGYIGTALGPMLLARGHEVAGLDAGFYGDRRLYIDHAIRPLCAGQDVRRLTEADLTGLDAVVHLAELSNDPLAELDPEVTYEINHRGTVALAERCRRAGVARFVYTSSCSVYGAGSDEYKTEDSETNPQTAYARCKLLVEREVSALADDDFSPTFLRNATAYGPSPSMRFDLVLNNLAGLAWTAREIRMTSDGTPLRPLVHVLDICHAIACALEAPREVVHGEIFNVGQTTENYRVREIAEIVAGAFPGCAISFGAHGGDTRSYRVSFDKIHERLPGFRCAHTVRDGAGELSRLFERIGLDRDTFEAPAFTRVRQLRRLLASGRLDRHLFWNSDRAVDSGIESTKAGAVDPGQNAGRTVGRGLPPVHTAVGRPSPGGGDPHGQEDASAGGDGGRGPAEHVSRVSDDSTDRTRDGGGAPAQHMPKVSARAVRR
jgi:nucleoside-diphosphate-sugar epimerase